MDKVIYDVSLFTDYDIYLFKQGNHFRLHEKLGAHLMTVNDIQGAFFGVWAPNAANVSVIGDFNGWNTETHPLRMREDGSGIWEGFIPHIKQGTLYKYHIVSKYNHYEVDKGDPYAFYWEVSPKTASIVWDLSYEWKDSAWMTNRYKSNNLRYGIYSCRVYAFNGTPLLWFLGISNTGILCS